MSTPKLMVRTWLFDWMQLALGSLMHYARSAAPFQLPTPRFLAFNADGATTLHRAAYNGTKEVVAYLLTNGASCDVIDADGRTPLHWAIHNVDHGALSALLKHAKSEIINLQDNDGMTALMTAAHLQQ